MRIFLSHSSKDKPFVRAVRGAIAPYVDDTWIDEAEILPGDSLYGQIQSGVAESQRVLAFLSKDSVDSRWVQRELEGFYALEDQEQDVKVIPIVLDDVQLPPFLAPRLQIRNPEGELSTANLVKIIKAVYRTDAVVSIDVATNAPHVFPSLIADIIRFQDATKLGALVLVVDHSSLDDIVLNNLVDDVEGMTERFRLAWPRAFGLFAKMAPRLGACVFEYYGRDVSAPAELNRLLTVVWKLVCLSLLVSYRFRGNLDVIREMQSVVDEFEALDQFTADNFQNRSYPAIDRLWQYHLNLSFDETYDLGFQGIKDIFSAGHISVPKRGVSEDSLTIYKGSSPETEIFGHVWIRQVLPQIVAKAILNGAYSSYPLDEFVGRVGIRRNEYIKFGIE